MKRRAFAVVSALGALLALLLISTNTALAAKVPGDIYDICGNDRGGAEFTTQVVNRPDSGLGGNNWAHDTFTRVTYVCTPAEETPNIWEVHLVDSGSFTSLPGVTSPGGGATLPSAPVTGSFKGGATMVVTAEAESPTSPGTTSDGTVSSSGWSKLLFPNGTAVMGAWKWTYTSTCGDTWVNASTGSTGDIAKLCPPAPKPGQKCKTDDGADGYYFWVSGKLVCKPKVKPTSVTPGPPTSTTTPVSTSSTPPSSTTGGSSKATSVTYANCDEVIAAGKAPLYADKPGYRFRLDRDGDGIACELEELDGATGAVSNVSNRSSGGLASTGASNIGTFTAIGGVLLLAGAASVVLVRRRKSAR